MGKFIPSIIILLMLLPKLKITITNKYFIYNYIRNRLIRRHIKFYNKIKNIMTWGSSIKTKVINLVGTSGSERIIQTYGKE